MDVSPNYCHINDPPTTLFQRLMMWMLLYLLFTQIFHQALCFLLCPSYHTHQQHRLLTAINHYCFSACRWWIVAMLDPLSCHLLLYMRSMLTRNLGLLQPNHVERHCQLHTRMSRRQVHLIPMIFTLVLLPLVHGWKIHWHQGSLSSHTLPPTPRHSLEQGLVHGRE